MKISISLATRTVYFVPDSVELWDFRKVFSVPILRDWILQDASAIVSNAAYDPKERLWERDKQDKPAHAYITRGPWSYLFDVGPEHIKWKDHNWALVEARLHLEKLPEHGRMDYIENTLHIQKRFDGGEKGTLGLDPGGVGREEEAPVAEIKIAGSVDLNRLTESSDEAARGGVSGAVTAKLKEHEDLRDACVESLRVWPKQGALSPASDETYEAFNKEYAAGIQSMRGAYEILKKGPPATPEQIRDSVIMPEDVFGLSGAILESHEAEDGTKVIDKIKLTSVSIGPDSVRVRERVGVEELDFELARTLTQQILSTINSCGFTAPEAMQPRVNQIARLMSGLAEALKITPR